MFVGFTKIIKFASETVFLHPRPIGASPLNEGSKTLGN